MRLKKRDNLRFFFLIDLSPDILSGVIPVRGKIGTSCHF